MYKIMGRYKNAAVEEIDEFDTLNEAREALREYKLAFGSDFDLWIKST